MLSEDQLEGIHAASLEVLAHTGCIVPLAEARDLLAAAGARVEGERVYIPPAAVERALSTVRPVTLYNRLGEPVMPLAEGRVTFGALVDNLYVEDAYEPRMRPFLRGDLGWSARLLDALPNVDWVACSGQMHDVAPELQTQLAFLGAVTCTTKPILVYPYDRRGLLDILDAASIIAGGREALRHDRSSFAPRCPTRRWSRRTTTWISCWRVPSKKCRSSTTRIPRWVPTARPASRARWCWRTPTGWRG